MFVIIIYFYQNFNLSMGYPSRNFKKTSKKKNTILEIVLILKTYTTAFLLYAIKYRYYFMHKHVIDKQF